VDLVVTDRRKEIKASQYISPVHSIHLADIMTVKALKATVHVQKGTLFGATFWQRQRQQVKSRDETQRM